MVKNTIKPSKAVNLFAKRLWLTLQTLTHYSHQGILCTNPDVDLRVAYSL